MCFVLIISMSQVCYCKIWHSGKDIFWLKLLLNANPCVTLCKICHLQLSPMGLKIVYHCAFLPWLDTKLVFTIIIKIVMQTCYDRVQESAMQGTLCIVWAWLHGFSLCNFTWVYIQHTVLSGVTHGGTLFWSPWVMIKHGGLWSIISLIKFCWKHWKVKSFLRRMAHRAVPISVSITLGHRSAESSQGYSRGLVH